MKILLIAISLFVISCANPYPKEPDIKHFYVVLFDGDQNPICTRYDIISQIPFKIKNPKYFDIEHCQGMGGFFPDDIQKLINYSKEVKKWAEETQKKCRL